MIADLHTRSAASDGQYAPSEAARLEKERGLDVLALTDHDTLDGLDEATGAGKSLGVRVLRDVELSARERRNLHILGYGFSPDAPGLLGLCEQMRTGQDERKYRIIDFLLENSVELSRDEVELLAGEM